jgi:hypothetical protein
MAETEMTDTPTIANTLDDRVGMLDILFWSFTVFQRVGYPITRESYKRISRSQRAAIARPSSSTGT